MAHRSYRDPRTRQAPSRQLPPAVFPVGWRWSRDASHAFDRLQAVLQVGDEPTVAALRAELAAAGFLVIPLRARLARLAGER